MSDLETIMQSRLLTSDDWACERMLSVRWVNLGRATGYFAKIESEASGVRTTWAMGSGETPALALKDLADYLRREEASK